MLMSPTCLQLMYDFEVSCNRVIVASEINLILVIEGDQMRYIRAGASSACVCFALASVSPHPRALSSKNHTFLQLPDSSKFNPSNESHPSEWLYTIH